MKLSKKESLEPRLLQNLWVLGPSKSQNSPVTEVNEQSKIEVEHIPEEAKPNNEASKYDKSKDVINQKAEIDNLDASIEKDAVFEMSF